MISGSNPSDWADQCIRFLDPFVDYLKAVKETNDMNPPGFEGKAYVHATIFYIMGKGFEKTPDLSVGMNRNPFEICI